MSNHDNNDNSNIKGLQQLADRCVDVIELVKAAEPSSLTPVDLSALAELAYASQINHADHLLNALMKLSIEFYKNLYTKYCEPAVIGFVNDVEALVQPNLSSVNHSGSLFAVNAIESSTTPSSSLAASAA